MKKISAAVLIFVGIICLSSCSDSNSKTHPKLNLEDVRQEFIACKKKAKKKHTCKGFVAKAINGNFEISDFNHKEKEGEYVDYNEIEAIVEASLNWIKVGYATDQAAMDYVQNSANAGKPALAIKTKSGHSNVAIIVKGELIKSTSWGLNCPTVAFFFPKKPKKSFVGKTLNYAWGKPDGISLYVRE